MAWIFTVDTFIYLRICHSRVSIPHFFKMVAIITITSLHLLIVFYSLSQNKNLINCKSCQTCDGLKELWNLVFYKTIYKHLLWNSHSLRRNSTFVSDSKRYSIHSSFKHLTVFRCPSRQILLENRGLGSFTAEFGSHQTHSKRFEATSSRSQRPHGCD